LTIPFLFAQKKKREFDIFIIHLSLLALQRKVNLYFCTKDFDVLNVPSAKSEMPQELFVVNSRVVPTIGSTGVAQRKQTTWSTKTTWRKEEEDISKYIERQHTI